MAKSSSEKSPASGPPKRLAGCFYRAFQTRVDAESQKRVAEEARVSTKNVNHLYRNIFATDPLPTDAPQKRLHEYAEVIARLAVFLGVEVDQALREYDIPLTDGVRQAVARSRTQAVAPRFVSDPTLNRIMTRDGGPEVHVGLAIYPPFHRLKEQSSFAQRFMESCVGAINPDFRIEFHDLKSMNDCTDALLSKPAHVDAVVGLYDTPNRQFMEMGFLHLPGFLVPLAAISTSAEYGWKSLLDTARPDRPIALALRGEAGHVLLEGACRYVGGRDLHVIDETNVDAIGNVVAQRFAELRVKRPVVFVCGEAFCRQVHKVMETGHEQSVLGDTSSHLIANEDEAPVYRVGIALRGDAKEWASLLRSAISTELLANALPVTASIYAQLFAHGECGSLRWTWDEFPDQAIGRFGACVLSHLTRTLPRLGRNSGSAKEQVASLVPKGFLPLPTKSQRKD